MNLRSEWRAGDVALDVESPSGTLVVLNETRSIGWTATVDGTPVSIYPVNEAFQGVAVAAGRHRVRWTFASPGFGVGLAVAAVGLGVIAVAPAWSRRRSRADGP